MMFRKKQPETRRQRLAQDNQPKIASFAYTSRQSQQTDRTSRQDLAKQASKRPKRWPALFWLQRIGLLVIIIAVVILAIDALTLSSSAKIVSLRAVAGHSYLQSDQTYASAANAYLKSSIWNRNKITANTNGLSQQLLKQFPELVSASVTMPVFSRQPEVYIQAAQPALVMNTANGNYIIGNSGKAMDKLDNSAAGPAGLPYLIDQSGLNIQPRQQALPASDVQFMQVIVAEMAAKQYAVSNLTLPPASNEVDARLVGQPYYVKFNLQDDDPAGQAGTFLATIANLKKQNITPSQYVDVRIDGRAYYQ